MYNLNIYVIQLRRGTSRTFFLKVNNPTVISLVLYGPTEPFPSMVCRRLSYETIVSTVKVLPFGIRTSYGIPLKVVGPVLFTPIHRV